MRNAIVTLLPAYQRIVATSPSSLKPSLATLAMARVWSRAMRAPTQIMPSPASVRAAPAFLGRPILFISVARFRGS